MEFIEYCPESKKQHGCVGAEWLSAYRLFTLPTGGADWGLWQLPMTDYHTANC